MFLDLPDIWESTWTVNDFALIFEILRWNGTFEEAISTMKIIHEKGQTRTNTLMRTVGLAYRRFEWKSQHNNASESQGSVEVDALSRN